MNPCLLSVHNHQVILKKIEAREQVVMPLIEFIQENNTTNKLPLYYKGYADMNPCLLSVHNHHVILEKN